MPILLGADVALALIGPTPFMPRVATPLGPICIEHLAQTLWVKEFRVKSLGIRSGKIKDPQLQKGI